MYIHIYIFNIHSHIQNVDRHKTSIKANLIHFQAWGKCVSFKSDEKQNQKGRICDLNLIFKSE